MTLTLTEQVARMFTVGFHGTVPSRELTELIQRGVGGIILFGRNVESPGQVLELTRAIKRLAERPIFISIDQEGGKVRRLRQGFSDVVAMRALGKLGDAQLAFDIGRLLGRELQAVGIDVNLAPVVDVDTNVDTPIIGDRAFSSDPLLVATLGAALIRGMQEVGVAACAKHFPGHGDTWQDSHLELPRLTHAMDRLEQVELLPFRAVAKAGVASIMTAHVVFEALDAARPATMSRDVLEGLLRQSMGYTGLIFSDDTEMKAIADQYSYPEAAVLAANAGVDSILVCHTAEVAHQMIDSLLHAVNRGEVSRERVAEANRRVQHLLDGYAAPARSASDLSVLACPEHVALAQRLKLSLEGEGSGPDPTERFASEAPGARDQRKS
jgi:beta-N-acetylhexosaminidase